MARGGTVYSGVGGPRRTTYGVIDGLGGTSILLWMVRGTAFRGITYSMTDQYMMKQQNVCFCLCQQELNCYLFFLSPAGKMSISSVRLMCFYLATADEISYQIDVEFVKHHSYHIYQKYIVMCIMPCTIATRTSVSEYVCNQLPPLSGLVQHSTLLSIAELSSRHSLPSNTLIPISRNRQYS